MGFYIGVDPGVGGGIAIIHEDGRPLRAVKMPEAERDLLELLRPFGTGADAEAIYARAYLERVRASPQMGVVSAFTFGRGYGGLRMALVAAGIPFEEVLPHRWQKALGCLSGGDKNVTKRRAQELFPVMPVTHSIADALLLAEFGRRSDRGLLPAEPERRMRAGANLF